MVSVALRAYLKAWEQYNWYILNKIQVFINKHLPFPDFYFVLWLYCMIVRNSVAMPADDIRPPSVQHYTQELRGFSPYNSNPGPFLYTPFGSKNAMTH